jgi:hypothetical protein
MSRLNGTSSDRSRSVRCGAAAASTRRPGARPNAVPVRSAAYRFRRADPASSVAGVCLRARPPPDPRQRHPDSHSPGQAVCDLLARASLGVDIRLHERVLETPVDVFWIAGKHRASFHDPVAHRNHEVEPLADHAVHRLRIESRRVDAELLLQYGPRLRVNPEAGTLPALNTAARPLDR